MDDLHGNSDVLGLKKTFYNPQIPPYPLFDLLMVNPRVGFEVFTGYKKKILLFSFLFFFLASKPS